MATRTLTPQAASAAPNVRGALQAALYGIASSYGNPDWLIARRRAALDSYESAVLPPRVSHLWRYTDPAIFLPNGDHRLPRPPAEGAARSFPKVIESELGTEALAAAVLSRDGLVLKTAVDDKVIAAGVKILDLHQAARELPEVVSRHLGSLAGPETGKFEALANALWTGGVFVYVPRGVDVGRPVHLFTSPSEIGASVYQRLLVILEEGATLTLIDEYGEDHANGGSPHANSIVELYLSRGARLTYAPLQNWGRQTVGYMTQRARLEDDARLETVITSVGSSTFKMDCGASLVGKGSESIIHGLAIGTDRQHLDHHTVHQHVAGSTHSDLHFKTALRDKANSVYTGLIGIEANAPYCEAYQENRNLLLSPGARAETIPELEIKTNEVRCTHGATVGKVNPDEIFYLESRGIEKREAIRLIVTGFVGPIMDRLPDIVRGRVHTMVLERLGETPGDEA